MSEHVTVTVRRATGEVEVFERAVTQDSPTHWTLSEAISLGAGDAITVDPWAGLESVVIPAPITMTRLASAPWPQAWPKRSVVTPDERWELWRGRAARLLEEALAAIEAEDVIPTVDAALQALRIGNGEADADTMDGYPFPGEEPDEEGCTCPPGLVARGGYRGSCPVHGVGVVL